VDASRSQQEFVRHLPQAIINSTAVVLHSGTYFLGEPKLGSTLMIRPFWYPKVEQAMRHHFDNGGRALGIVGNPGEQHDGFFQACLLFNHRFNADDLNLNLQWCSYRLDVPLTGCGYTRVIKHVDLAGIGKSLFAYLMLCRWVLEGKQVSIDDVVLPFTVKYGVAFCQGVFCLLRCCPFCVIST
jgi:hypothetical protein